MILAMLIAQQHLQQHSQWDAMSVFFIIIIIIIETTRSQNNLRLGERHNEINTRDHTKTIYLL